MRRSRGITYYGEYGKVGRGKLLCAMIQAFEPGSRAWAILTPEEYRDQWEMNHLLLNIAQFSNRKPDVLVQIARAPGEFRTHSFTHFFLHAVRSPEDLAKDLRTWWPKIYHKGTLAGRPANRKGYMQVIEAFAKDQGVSLFDDANVWWIDKIKGAGDDNGMEGEEDSGFG